MRAWLFLLALAWAPAALAAQAPQIAIDRSAGFARILVSFEGDGTVGASLADGVLTLEFDTAIGAPVETFTTPLAPILTSGRREADGRTYRFAVAMPLALQRSVSGNRTAIDLVPPSYGGTPPDLPPPPGPQAKRVIDPATLPVIAVRAGEHSDFSRLVFDWPRQLAYTVDTAPGRASLRVPAQGRPDLAAVNARRLPWLERVAWRIDGTDLVVDVTADPHSSIRHGTDGAKIILDIMAPGGDADAVGAQTTEIPETAPEAADTPVAPVPAQSELTRDGGVLRLHDAKGKPVAVFTRGDVLWIVVDSHAPVDPVTLLAPIETLIERAETDDTGGAAVLRLRLKQHLIPTVSESEAALEIALSPSGIPPQPVSFAARSENGLPALGARMTGAARALTLDDSAAGDRIVVIPARPGQGVVIPRRFVEFEILPSLAGAAILPYTDDLKVGVTDETAIIGREQGLVLSSSAPAERPNVKRPAGGAPGFIDFARWGTTQQGTVFERQRVLRTAAAERPESDANEARLTLARFLLAQELAPEALGEIALIRASDPASAGDPALQAMTGAAQYMMGRYDEAKRTLSSALLDGDAHAALWRGLAAAKTGDWTAARRDLARSLSVVAQYPALWQSAVHLARAETGLAQGDLASASEALGRLPRDLPQRDAALRNYLAAQLLAAQGSRNEALAQMRLLERAASPAIAARATYDRVQAERAAGKITDADAIEALERLRFRWRGDDLELKTFKTLGDLYFAGSRWREGFDTLRLAATYFPASDMGREAQRDMRTAFRDLFLGGKSAAMSPVESVSLFYDFIDLTPIGRDGDEMIRLLTDTLVAVDLLEPAAQLLEHQVTQRLTGTARASVATRLATIYLSNRKAEDALRIIDETRQTLLSEDLIAQRRLIEARARGSLKQFAAALAVIGDDETPAAQTLRAELLWESGDWNNAGAALEGLLAAHAPTDGALDDSARALVLRAAVAYSLADDAVAGSRLRARYGAAMAAGPDAKSFALVTEPGGVKGVPFRELAREMSSLDLFESFMSDFRSRTAAPASAGTLAASE